MTGIAKTRHLERSTKRDGTVQKEIERLTVQCQDGGMRITKYISGDNRHEDTCLDIDAEQTEFLLDALLAWTQEPSL